MREARGRASVSSCLIHVVRTSGGAHAPLVAATGLVRTTATKEAPPTIAQMTPAVIAIRNAVRIAARSPRTLSRLEGGHAPDDDVADQDQEARDTEQDVADERARHGGKVAWDEHVQAKGEEYRKARDDGCGCPRLRRQHAHVALGLDAVAQGVGDVVEHLGQVASDSGVQKDRRDDELEVRAVDPQEQRAERFLYGRAESDFVGYPFELCRDRWL